MSAEKQLGRPPRPPEVTSPSHPSDRASKSSSPVFEWRQADGDTSEISGYRWLFGRSPDTVPDERNDGMRSILEMSEVPDGGWYLHVRAVDKDGQWSETTHYGPVRIGASDL